MVGSAGNGGAGCTQFVRGLGRMTIGSRIHTIPGRSTSGFHQPGRHCLHQARSAVRCSYFCRVVCSGGWWLCARHTACPAFAPKSEYQVDFLPEHRKSLTYCRRRYRTPKTTRATYPLESREQRPSPQRNPCAFLFVVVFAS